MKAVRRWRYYCDHCKKVGGAKCHMERHEAACTANPDRVCGFCAKTGCGSGLSTAELVAVLDAQGFAALVTLADCPACTLAALRQTKAFIDPAGDESAIRYNWSFKDEMDKAYNAWRSMENEEFRAMVGPVYG